LHPDQIAFVRRTRPDFDPATWRLEVAGAAGSQRYFLRLASKTTSAILMVWDSQDPDWPRCLGIHDALANQCDLIPRMFDRDPALGLILEEDFGQVTLHRALAAGGDLPTLYRQVVPALLAWQRVDCAADPVLSARVMRLADLLWESEYFSEHLAAGHCGAPELLTPAWHAERERLAAETDALPKVWMHRDFQSENIMVHQGRVRFVDYQGARVGPVAYDLASLLYDPYVPALTAAHVTELRDLWLAGTPHAVTPRDFALCAAQRLLQALGAYGNLSRNKGKPRYLAFIPLALARLAAVAAELPDYPELGKIVHACRARAQLPAPAVVLPATTVHAVTPVPEPPHA
jgi:aminoglycoside/choline kinase family phosphotransferase